MLVLNFVILIGTMNIQKINNTKVESCFNIINI